MSHHVYVNQYSLVLMFGIQALRLYPSLRLYKHFLDNQAQDASLVGSRLCSCPESVSLWRWLLLPWELYSGVCTGRTLRVDYPILVAIVLKYSLLR